MIFGLLLIYLRYKVMDIGMRPGTLLMRSIFFLFGIIALFGLISSFRTVGDNHALTQSYIGYGPTSINHLAAILDGQFSTENLHEYLVQENFGFIYKFPFASRLLNLTETRQIARQSSFSATWRAGLNGSFNWFTSFGEIFVGLGIIAIPYLLVYGMILGVSWKAFRAGRMWGMVIYPWTAFGVMFCFGSNYFAGQPLSILVLLTIILYAYRCVVFVCNRNFFLKYKTTKL